MWLIISPVLLPHLLQASPQRRENSPQRRGVHTSATAAAEPLTAPDAVRLPNGSGLSGGSGSGGFNGSSGGGSKKAAAAAPPAAPAPEPEDLLNAAGEKQPRSLKKLRSVVADLKARQAELQEQMGSAAQVRAGVPLVEVCLFCL